MHTCSLFQSLFNQGCVLFPLCSFSVFSGDGLVQEFVDTVDNVGTNLKEIKYVKTHLREHKLDPKLTPYAPSVTLK